MAAKAAGGLSALRSKSSKRWSALKGLAHANAVVKTIPHGIDSETFLGDSIPPEIKAAVPALHDVPDHRAIISQVVEDMQRPLASTAPAHSEATAPEDAFEAQTRAAAYTGVLMLLQAAIRHRTKLSVVQADLTKMNAPEAFVSDFVAVLRRHRATLEEATVQHSTRFPALDKLKWRVDVTISSSSARRVMQPALLMETALSDGSLHSFEMPIDKFHALRHSVARMLLEMGDIRAHPVIQLAFDAEKAALDKP